MNGGLHKDMGNNDNIMKNDIPDPASQNLAKIPSHLTYACMHWMDHAGSGAMDDTILTPLTEFCEKHLLHWLEVMSVIGAVDLRICKGLQDVRSALKVSNHSHTSPL